MVLFVCSAGGGATANRQESYDVAYLAAQTICFVMACGISTERALEVLNIAACLFSSEHCSSVDHE